MGVSAVPDPDRLPASTLQLLTSMLTADLGAGTARKWADDVLKAGASSDALIELALLEDHEWNRVSALLPQALRDAGIEPEPRGSLLVLFYRLLIGAWLDGHLGLNEFELLLETRLVREPGAEAIGEDRRKALGELLHTLALRQAYLADREECPVATEEDEVAMAARTALARLSA